MSPSVQGVGAALAKWLEKRAVVQQVYGPYAKDGETTYRVAMNNGAIINVKLSVYKEPL